MVKFGNDWDELLKDEWSKPYYRGLRDFLIDEYKKETVNWCPASEDSNDIIREKLIEKYDCIGASKKCYNQKQYEIALDYAKKIKYIFRTKDLNALANIAPYPSVYIYNYKNKEFIEIKSKQQLLKMDRKAILNRNTYNDIYKSNLFWNWKGFMLGRGAIWFYVEDKVVMLAIYLQ